MRVESRSPFLTVTNRAHWDNSNVKRQQRYETAFLEFRRLHSFLFQSLTRVREYLLSGHSFRKVAEIQRSTTLSKGETIQIYAIIKFMKCIAMNRIVMDRYELPIEVARCESYVLRHRTDRVRCKIEQKKKTQVRCTECPRAWILINRSRANLRINFS